MKKLKLLLAFCALFLIGGGNFASAQETPTDNGIYYLYNSEADLFLSRGNNWGTQAIASPVGLPWKVSVAEGKYTLRMYDYTVEGTTSGFNGDYTDGATPIQLTPNGDASNGFTLQNGSNYVTCPATKGAVTMTTTASKWKFLTQAQYKSVLDGRATAQETAVATSKGIEIPLGKTLDEVVSDGDNWTSAKTQDAVPTSSTWTVTKFDSPDWRKAATNWGNYGGELYQESNGHYTRTITGLSSGIYKVSVRAMKRLGSNGNCHTMGEAGYPVSDAYLKANGNIIPIKAWYENCTANDAPNGPAAVVSIIENGGYTTEGFVYVGDDGNLVMDLASEAFIGSCWTIFNGISYTFYNNEVSDDDATAILATATDVLDKAMLKATKDALSDAKTTFDGARTIANYNALNTAIENANASIAAYAPLGTKLTEAASVKSSVSSNSPSYVTTFDTNIGAITSDYNAGNYAESAISTQVAAVETEIIALVKSQTVVGSDMTRIVPNAACTGAAGDDNWKIKNALASGEYFRLDTWAGTASGMSVPMIEYWISNGNTLSSNEMYQTISGLSNGVYRVTAETAVNNESNTAPNAGSALLFANDATTAITTGGTQTSFKGQTGTFTIEGVVSDGSLSLGLKAVSPNYNWIAFKNVHLYYMGAKATSAEKEALADAIADVEGKILGFEDGEYAPYNNVDAIEALATAKAIDPETASGSAVVAATTALTEAIWKANDGSVECVYNGNFAEGQGSPAANIQQYGWTRTNGWGQFKNDGFGSSTAYYNQPGSLQYGNAGVYTMPLKAQTIYRLQFKYAKWDGNFAPTVSVLNEGSGMAAQTFENASSSYKNGYNSVDMVFVTAAAGNYVLSLSASSNYVITGVSITKAASQVLEFVDGSVPTYAPGTYPSVKITRTLTAGKWATAVYPFAVSGVNNIAVLDSYDKETGTIGFTSAAASKANEPFLMRSTATVTEISLSNVAVVATVAEPEVTKSEASLKGAYTATDINNEEKNYVLSNNQIFSVGAAGATINPYRAYIQLSEGGGSARALSFVVDGQITGVDNVKAASETEVKDGKYLENGKIVIVKNGKKFNAAGAKLY